MLCRGAHLQLKVTSEQPVVQRLTDRLLCRSAGEQATCELEKLKQQKQSIARYIEKYCPLVGRKHMVDHELFYWWLIAGLSHEERPSVTEWTADVQL